MCLSATSHQSIHLPAIYCHKSGERENSSSVYRSAQHPSLSVSESIFASNRKIPKQMIKTSNFIQTRPVCFSTLLTLTKVQLVLSPVTPVSEEPDSKRTPGICRSLNRPTRFTVFSIFTSLWTYIFIILYQISAEATNFIIMCIGHWTVQRACWSSALFDLCVFFIFHPVSSNMGQWHPIFRT